MLQMEVKIVANHNLVLALFIQQCINSCGSLVGAIEELIM